MSKVVRDPIWGDVKVSRSECDVIDTPQFQRLRGIRQLGLAYLVYPGAIHTRFLHSIGTVAAAQTMLTTMKEEGTAIDSDTTDAIRMFALLHDVGHYPFAHLLSDEMGIYSIGHDDKEHLKPIVDTISDEVHDMPQEAIEMLLGETPPPKRLFMQDMVSNTVCADLVDYIQRDGYFSGATGLGFRFDNRLLGYFKLVPDQDGAIRLAIVPVKDKIRLDVITDLLQLLRYRYVLTERITYHHAKLAASAMLAKAVVWAGQPDSETLATMTDDRFLDHVAHKSDNDGLASDLVNGLLERRLYKPVFRLTRKAVSRMTVEGFAKKFGTPKGRENLEMEILDEASGLVPSKTFHEGDIVLYTSPDYRMTFKAAGVLVKWKGDAAIPLRNVIAEEYWETTIQQEVKALEDKYDALWSAYVFVNPSLRDFAFEIEKACAEVLEMENDPLLSQSLSREDTYSDIKLAQRLMDRTGLARSALEISHRNPRAASKEDRLKEALKDAIRAHGRDELKKDEDKPPSKALEKFDDEPSESEG
ncbi:MAG: HD domain-containing protein [Thermoplasmata archaeon]|nr:HD domain-containing protein [Thermoplasmata archaeon]